MEKVKKKLVIGFVKQWLIFFSLFQLVLVNVKKFY